MKMMMISLICLILVGGISGCVSQDVHPTENQITEKTMGSYLHRDHSCPPFLDNSGNNTEVTIRILITQIRSRESQEISFNLYLFKNWADNRMKFQADTQEDYYVVHRKYLDNIWLPQVHIDNYITADSDQLDKNSFLWIYPNGTLLHGTKLSATVHCPTEKIKLPKGYMSCHLNIDIRGGIDAVFNIALVVLLADSFEKKSVSMRWHETNPISFSGRYERDKLQIQKWKNTTCKYGSFKVVDTSCIALKMDIQKYFSISMLRLYLPSIFIVIVGWLSFWIDKEEVSSRVKLGTLCLLSMITEEIGISMILPDEIYVSEIEIWFSVCLAFVTFAMCEFALVHAVDRFQTKIKAFELNFENENDELKKLADGTYVDVNKYKIDRSDISNKQNRCQSERYSYQSISHKQSLCCYIRRLSTGKIEKFSRIIYAIAFVLFQVLYWLYYIINEYTE